jgi:hypothetical protein
MAIGFRKICIVLLFAVLSIMSGNSFGGPAGGMMTGGYSEADVNSDNVKEAAEFAVHQQYPDGGVSYKVIEGTHLTALQIRIMKHGLIYSLHESIIFSCNITNLSFINSSLDLSMFSIICIF